MRHLWAHTPGRNLQNHSVIWWSDKCPRVWLLARVTAALDKGCRKKIWIYQNVHWRETIVFYSSQLRCAIRVPSQSQIQGWPGKTSDWCPESDKSRYWRHTHLMLMWCVCDAGMMFAWWWGEQEERWMCCDCGLQRLYHSVYKARNSF